MSVIEAGKAPGDPWTIRRYQLATFALVGALVGGLGIWGASVTIEGAVISSGTVVVESRRIPVQHPTGGVVARLAVTEGERVKKGQLLLSLDGSEVMLERVTTENQMAELSARRGRLLAEQKGLAEPAFDASLLSLAAANPRIAELVEGQRVLFAARRGSFQAEVSRITELRAQLVQQIGAIQAQSAAVREQLVLNEGELESMTRLRKQGLARDADYFALRKAEVQLRGMQGEYAAKIAELNARDAELDVEMTRLVTGRLEESVTTLREIHFKEFDFAAQLAELDRKIALLDLHAPADGVVYGLAVTSVSTVVPHGETILSIVPDNADLVISARVDAKDIEQVHVGQMVEVKFSGLTGHLIPRVFGKTRLVSPDAFDDQATGHKYYMAEVEVDDGELARLGDVSIVPGMPADVFYKTTPRTPLSFLTQPLTDFVSHSFRE